MPSDPMTSLIANAPADNVGMDASDDGYKLSDDFAQLQYATIMMVDDEPITMEVVQTFLEDAGYRKFILVEDSVIALDKLREHKPDVLLLDVIMPEVNGFDILQDLRRDDEFSHLPVIILTSSSDAETKLKALDLGATDFLSKPVDPSELALRVRNTLAAKAYQDHLAFYDALTNLPNRHLFQNRADWAIEQARREESTVAMLHVTFDDFKRVTDTFGPKVGDAVLKQLAERLTTNLRSTDAVSREASERAAWRNVFRIGSADFSILLTNVEGIEYTAYIGQRIIDAMNAPFSAEGTDVYLKPSVGVAGFPGDASDTASLIKLALGASSQAVTQGGGRLQFYSAAMNDISLQRFRLEADLRSALERNEFTLLYQPKVSVAGGQILGAEALIRWRRPDGTIVYPADFIPTAEETGLILPIGEWVINEACEQVARWSRLGIDLRVSVNISARQLFETDLVAIVEAAIGQVGIEPSQITIEVTESLLMDRVDEAIDSMARLRAHGVRISMDDFGTGYSSLSYLKEFPLDEVKIDRAFITDSVRSRADQALISAVTYLAHEFGFEVCAEGVEESDQLDLLRKVKCDEFQGYLFSKPIEAEALTDKLLGKTDKFD